MTVKTLDGLVTAARVTSATDATGNGYFFGTSAVAAMSGLSGNDTFNAGSGDQLIDGGSGYNTALYQSTIKNYILTKNTNGFTVNDVIGIDGIDTLTNIQKLQFSDMSVNLTIKATATRITTDQLRSIEELYIAFFNRVPEADGLENWIKVYKQGLTINQIADDFYQVGTQYSSLTGYAATMANSDFINKVYANVLGRPNGADANGLIGWENALNAGTTRGELVHQILAAAHTYQGDVTWGWVADLLNNKVTVAHEFAVTLGLGYNDANTSISQGMAIAAAITPTDSSVAINMIGVSPINIIHLV